MPSSGSNIETMAMFSEALALGIARIMKNIIEIAISEIRIQTGFFFMGEFYHEWSYYFQDGDCVIHAVMQVPARSGEAVFDFENLILTALFHGEIKGRSEFMLEISNALQLKKEDR